MRVRWSIPEYNPPITSICVKIRMLGLHTWDVFDAASGKLMSKSKMEGTPKPLRAPVTECEVRVVLDGAQYEACVAFRNEDGWGPDSAPSVPSAPATRSISDYNACGTHFGYP